MKTVVIHLEGGGSSSEQRAKLRVGMDQFLAPLKQRADQKGWKINVVPRGGREETYREWARSVQGNNQAHNILLVDSEEEVTRLPNDHLRHRIGDGWIISKGLEPQVHLMAQCMETWLVADPDALEGYYNRKQKKFKRSRLPVRQNLEEEHKLDVYSALERATEDTTKGAYGKIEHGAALLALVDPAKARERCPHCERFFKYVAEVWGDKSP